jgi:hypothetical protein
MDSKKFLKTYVKAHGCQVFPMPTIENNTAGLINEVNGTPPFDTAADVEAIQEENGKAPPPPRSTSGSGRKEQKQLSMPNWMTDFCITVHKDNLSAIAMAESLKFTSRSGLRLFGTWTDRQLAQWGKLYVTVLKSYISYFWQI